MPKMTTSPKGVAFLERHEGVVLKAYRDPVGIWTIGAGLTAASGVVRPTAGMKISKAEASRLLALALERNYEPTVRSAMPLAERNEFDGGVSFHWNTGAISRASWVKAWRAKDWGRVQTGLNAWRKGGGRVLPGLERRRREEFQLIRYGNYGALAIPKMLAGEAREVVQIDPIQRGAIKRALRALGYDAGSDEVAGFPELGVRDFQRDHDLTVDGIIGKATLSTLQRRLDAKKKTALAGGTAAAGAVETQVDTVGSQLPDLPVADWAGWVLLGLGAILIIRLAWSYRDVLAVKLQSRFPETARKLRSF